MKHKITASYMPQKQNIPDQSTKKNYKDPTPINQNTRHSSLWVKENYIQNIFSSLQTI